MTRRRFAVGLLVIMGAVLGQAPQPNVEVDVLDPVIWINIPRVAVGSRGIIVFFVGVDTDELVAVEMGYRGVPPHPTLSVRVAALQG